MSGILLPASCEEAERFAQCCQWALADALEKEGIGSLGEKPLHAALKAYFAPNPADREIRFGPFVADIALRDRIIEIQSRNFGALSRKLELFLAQGPVEVVYPVVQRKWLCWLDPETGELSDRRRSPKQAGPGEIFRELGHIQPFLGRPGLSFRVMLVEAEEQRLLCGWSRDRKRGSRRYLLRPMALLGQLELGCPEDFACLIPDSLPQPFTAKEFAKASRLSPSRAGSAVKVLTLLGQLERDGNRGRAYLYRRPEGMEPSII